VLFIGNPDGEMGQLVRTGGCGAVVAEGDHGALCNWIVRLHDSPETCAAWGRNARHLFETRFDQKAACASWQHLLIAMERQPLAVPGSFQQTPPVAWPEIPTVR
jgi:glycosyltransferase involved in cell wall biosynthesis